MDLIVKNIFGWMFTRKSKMSYWIGPNLQDAISIVRINIWSKGCSNSSALAMELLQSCAKPSIDGCLFYCIIYILV